MLVADCFTNTMSASQHPFAASEVAEKVMRRIEIAKVARNLHDCLAFASFKAQNGWQDRTLKSLQPEITEKLKRKRAPFDEEDSASETSSFSDDPISTTSITSHRLPRPHTTAALQVHEHAYNPSRKRVRSASTATHDASKSLGWRQNNSLPHSSPPLANASHGFGAAGTMPRPAHEDSPMIDAPSDDEGRGAPLPSFNEPPSSIISSSPPRTPPPPRRLPPTLKQSGADLLLYLANSPPRSPAVHVTQVSSSSKPAPTTPPPHRAHLPSSVLNTPGQSLGLFNGALQTPGPNFNFADFCNVTPSPGEAQWGSRTPGPAKTPSRLSQSAFHSGNLSVLTSSPTLQRQQPPTSQGLALQLGEELLPRS